MDIEKELERIAMSNFDDNTTYARVLAAVKEAYELGKRADVDSHAWRVLRLISEMETTENGIYTNAGKVMRAMAQEALDKRDNSDGSKA